MKSLKHKRKHGRTRRRYSLRRGTEVRGTNAKVSGSLRYLNTELWFDVIHQLEIHSAICIGCSEFTMPFSTFNMQPIDPVS